MPTNANEAGWKGVWCGAPRAKPGRAGDGKIVPTKGVAMCMAHGGARTLARPDAGGPCVVVVVIALAPADGGTAVASDGVDAPILDAHGAAVGVGALVVVVVIITSVTSAVVGCMYVCRYVGR